ncbi:MAG: hypothetical protein H6862_03035 [Rhodospirillales bacterium]|nr:hypothetical protein [Rhodospirillales bacterium]
MQKTKSLTIAALGAAALLSACTTNPKVAAIATSGHGPSGANCCKKVIAAIGFGTRSGTLSSILTSGIF